MQAAVKLDLFSLLSGEGKDGEEVASRMSCDPRGLTALLDALSAMGLLEKKEGRYFLTEPSGRYRDRNSRHYMGWRILHHHYLLPSWARLDECVARGEPAVWELDPGNSEEQREAFLMAMYSNAQALSEKIVPFIDLGEAADFLDLGGGPGTYAVQFCLKYPNLKAVVYDLPATRRVAERTIREFALGERISFTGGDFHHDPIPGEYDVAWLSHVLHSSGPEDCQRLVSKATATLKPGGMILLHDFWLNENGDGPLFPALFALNMLVRNPDGRAYRESEGVAMLEQAGLTNIHRLDIRIPNDSAVICGLKGD